MVDIFPFSLKCTYIQFIYKIKNKKKIKKILTLSSISPFESSSYLLSLLHIVSSFDCSLLLKNKINLQITQQFLVKPKVFFKYRKQTKRPLLIIILLFLT